MSAIKKKIFFSYIDKPCIEKKSMTDERMTDKKWSISFSPINVIKNKCHP